MTDQTIRTNKPIFNTPFGLIIYLSGKEKLNKKDRFLSFLNLEEIPFYLIKVEDFPLTISHILNSLQARRIEQSSLLEDYQNRNPKIDNVLFFSGFSREQVEDFLEKIRDDKYPRFPLKAVATKNNYNFTFYKLIDELTQDRVVISHVINLRKRVKALAKYLADNNTLKSQQKISLQKDIDQAESLLKDVETNFDLELFRSQIRKFNHLLAKLKHGHQAEKPQLDETN
ncbi:MAG: DUF3783 domain-containing protein [Clostridiaceae bacterium]|nr:DUF3783 domain-containing protein [Clostridiaceae bacterium]